MLKRVIYQLVLLVLFAACEKEVQNYEEQIVVEGWIESGGYPTVFLTKTFVVAEGEMTDEEQSIVLPWGKVTVSDGTRTEVLTGDYDDRYTPPYVYSTSRMKGVPGHTYYLTVEYEDRVLRAQTSIPEPAELEALEVSPCEHIDSAYQITARFEDNQETKDYYLFLTRIHNRENRFYPSFLGVLDDAVLSEHNRYMVYRGMHKLTSKNHAYNPYFLETDLVRVKFARIDEATYHIHKAYEEMVTLSNNPLFASDISLPTNVQGGLGFWCGYAVTEYSVAIADSIR